MNASARGCSQETDLYAWPALLVNKSDYLCTYNYSYLKISTYLLVWKVLCCEEAAVLAAAGLRGGHQPRAAPRRRQGQPDRYLLI